MIKCSQIAVAVLFVVVLAGPVGAEVVGNQNWADSAYDYTTNIQNYGGAAMDTSTEWWVTGVSDADFGGDNDYVAGWRANAPGEYIIVNFVTGLEDLAGDDLVIRMYGGPNASADVLASTNGSSFTSIGTIGSGSPGNFRDETFDFAGLFGTDDVHYVKVRRAANGQQTGMFFDSFASVPEPATMVLLVCGGLAMLLRRRTGDG